MEWSLVVMFVSSAVVIVALSHWLATSRLEPRLKRLETDVRLIMEHLGVPSTTERALGEHGRRIDALLRRGRKIEAIKVYRELTGVGLKEAKDAVDQMDG